jgi:hypothetical protein
MKRVVFLTCIGSLALALTLAGASKGKQARRATRGKSAPSAHVVSARRDSHHVASARASRPARTHSFARAASAAQSSRIEAARTRSARVATANARVRARNQAVTNRQRNLARTTAAQRNRAEAVRIRNARAGTNIAAARQRNLSMARNVAVNRAANARVVNNWRNARFRDPTYAAFYNYNRRWHDRGWWRNHYSRVVFVLGGWWYWNAGYWYPAWGYDPYAYYPYDGPIYGYGDLTPDRIIVNVQVALQQQGYYAGAIDGDLGPQTRGALAAFQADHGLAVSSAVDRPTLQTLGLA